MQNYILILEFLLLSRKDFLLSWDTMEFEGTSVFGLVYC